MAKKKVKSVKKTKPVKEKKQADPVEVKILCVNCHHRPQTKCLLHNTVVAPSGHCSCFKA